MRNIAQKKKKKMGCGFVGLLMSIASRGSVWTVNEEDRAVSIKKNSRTDELTELPNDRIV